MSIKGDVLPGGINQEIQGVTTQTRAHPDDFNPNVLKPLLDNDVTMSKQLETLPSEALTFRPGYQIVESEQDTPFRLWEIKGRTLVNLLGRAGACDSIESWQIYGGKGNVDKDICTITGSGSVANPQAGNLNIGHTPEVGELLFVRANCSVDNEKCTEVGLYLYAANATPGRIYADRLKNPSPNQTYTISGIIRVTQNMIDNWAGMRIVIAYEYKFAENALNTVNKLNKVAMYKVPESVSGLSVDELLSKYPYVDSMTNVKNPYAIVTGGNLLPPFYEYDNPFGIIRVDAPYEITLTAAAPYSAVYKDIKVKPNMSYTLTCDFISSGEVAFINASEMSRGVDLNIPHAITANDSVKGATFTTGSGTDGLRVFFSGNAAGTFTFKNPMLIVGTEPKPFTPQQRSMLAFETELAADPVDGSNPDTLFMGDDGLPYVLGNWKKLVLNGSLSYIFGSKTTAWKQVYFDILQGVIDSEIVIKFNGTRLISNQYMDGSDQCAIDSSVKTRVHLTIPNTDSGWGSDYEPSQDEIKAYFLGWRMTSQETWNTTHEPYNGTGTKGWSAIYSGVGTELGNMGVVVGSGVTGTPTTINPYGYTPYRLQYLKAKPTVEPVRNYELGATLSAGSNMVEVGSGIVIRERAYPRLAGGVDWHINNTVQAGTPLKHRLKERVAFYAGGASVTSLWEQRGPDQYAYGKYRYATKVESYNPSDILYVTYTMLDPSLAATINGTVAANLRGTVSDLVKDVGDIGRRLSVVETKKAEKDAPSPQWIDIALLSGWKNKYTIKAGFYKDDLGIVHLRGRISGGSIAPGTVIANFPKGYGVAMSEHIIPSWDGMTNSVVPALVTIRGNQVELWNTAAGAQDIWLDGIAFRTDQ